MKKRSATFRRETKETLIDISLDLDGEGRTTYDAFLSNDKPLPSWITFLPSQKTFLINNLDKFEYKSLQFCWQNMLEWWNFKRFVF